MVYSNVYAKLFSIKETVFKAILEVFSYKSTLIYSGLLFVWQLVLWAQAFFIRKNLTGEFVVLHYNIDFGIDLVAPSGDIYLYSGLALLVILINFIILIILNKQKKINILIHYLLGGAWAFNIILSLVFLSIYLINFR